MTDFQPTLIRQQDGTFLISLLIAGREAPVALSLSESQLRTVTLQALQLLPDISPRYAVPDENEVYRLPARKLGLLDDHSMQVWLREIDATTLQHFLWFMDDEALAEKVIRNMSPVAGRMLIEDIAAELGQWDPDTAPLAHVEPGRRAATAALEIYEQLRQRGSVRSL